MNSYYDITLLIVDDEAEIRSGLRNIISWEDYSISVIGTAASGAEALDKIRYYEPDIVITDIQMPGMNGLELVRRAKEEQFDCSFVILSGYDDFQYAQTAIRYGIKDYLLKPISIKELTELIQALKQEILTKRELHSDQLSTLKKLRTAVVSLRKHDLVPQLLRNELSAAELTDVISEYSLPVKNTASCAVLIQAFTSLSDTEESNERSRFLAPLAETLERETAGMAVLISEQAPAGLLLIFNLPFHSERYPSLKDLLSSQIEAVEPSDTVKITAAVGEEVSSLQEISLSWQSARQVMTWHIYTGANQVIEPSVMKNEEPSVILPDGQLFDDILKDDVDAVRLHFSEYLNKLLYIPTPPPAYLYSMCNYVIVTFSSQLAKYLDGPPKSFTGNSYVTLQNLSSLDEIRDWMCEILCGFASELSVSRATKSDPLIEKAIDYLNKNLLKNPHTEDVCNYLGLSKSYFSTYFKNKTQLNFRDYLLDLKINYAQEQLKLSEHIPSVVATLLGYEDYRSFSRAFKARTGLTPSDYQKQYISEERTGQ